MLISGILIGLSDLPALHALKGIPNFGSHFFSGEEGDHSPPLTSSHSTGLNWPLQPPMKGLV